MSTTITPIADIYGRRDAMAEAVARWQAGNNAGEGYVPDDELADAECILRAENTDEVDVYRLADGTEIAVADAHGPWAVTITP
jgi:predicted signal transduction protein with EAL and GGDEF domain